MLNSSIHQNDFQTLHRWAIIHRSMHGLEKEGILHELRACIHGKSWKSPDLVLVCTSFAGCRTNQLHSCCHIGCLKFCLSLKWPRTQSSPQTFTSLPWIWVMQSVHPRPRMGLAIWQVHSKDTDDLPRQWLHFTSPSKWVSKQPLQGPWAI